LRPEEIEMIETTRTEDVFTLKMVAGENRVNPTFLEAFKLALDEVEAAEGPVAAVITGEGKFFSNGLDLEWMGSAPEGGALEVVNGLQGLYARLMAFPVPVVAAVNGHAFAGGAMLALACDLVVMREDRGFFCLPEVDINIPFTKGMAALVQCKLVPSVARDAMLSGRRYSGPDAVAAGIADSAVPEDQVVATAIELARAFAGKSPSVVSTIKKTMFAPALAGLEEVVEGGI